MKTNQFSFRPKKIVFFSIAIIILGIFFRFFNIEQKFYWYDEVFTSIRVAGYTETEIVQNVAQGQVIKLDLLKKYQTVNYETSISDTIEGLAIEEPQHPPLYYVAARIFVRIFGASISSIRNFSAFLSLLVLPCIYWLCLELFNSSVVGWLAVAIVAISPFHVLYAQEAREYSLWTGLILLTSAVFLRAMRLKTVLSWVWYAITLAIGFYCFPFTGLVAIGHTIYAVIIEKINISSKTIKACLLSVLGAFLLFFPWIYLTVNNSSAISDTTNWSSNYRQPLSVLSRNWIVGISRLFFDINIRHNSPILYVLLMAFISVAIISLFFYSVYFLVKTSNKEAYLFVLILTAITALSLILPDLLFGGIRSTKDRYLIPSYLGLQISIAYLIGIKLSKINLRITGKKIWLAITTILFLLSIISNLVSSQSDNWWLKEVGYQNPPIARIINRSTKPLVISDLSSSKLGNVISLSYLLKPQTKFQLVQKAETIDIPKNFSDIFIYGTCGALRSQFKAFKNLKIVPVYQEKKREVWLWKTVK